MPRITREQPILHRLLDVLLDQLRRQILLLEAVVFEYGTADALIEDDFSEAIVVHDYVHYCFTKSCKTLRGVEHLLNQGLPEDAMTLLRGVYENYLHIVFVIQNPERIGDFVWKKIALRTGRLQPALSAKGKRIPGKMLDTATGEIVPFGIGDVRTREWEPLYGGWHDPRNHPPVFIGAHASEHARIRKLS